MSERANASVIPFKVEDEPEDEHGEMLAWVCRPR